MRLLLNTLFVLLLSFPAWAEDYTYAPENCDFRMSFPEEPRTVKRCHEKASENCTMMSNYTKVYGVEATVNLYVSCQPSAQELRAQFTSDAMRTALLARPGVDSLEVYDISYNDGEFANSGALIGAGKTANGNDVMVYVAQIWVGDNSTLTLEGELIGHDIEEADQLFADILRSLRHKDDLPRSTPEETQSDDTEATNDEKTENQDEKNSEE